jgi:ribosomal protein L7/L12
MHWDLTDILVGVLLVVAGYRIGYSRGHRPAGPDQARQTKVLVSDENLRAELRAGRKVEAIRRHPQRHGAGLKQAKDAAEAIDAGMGHVRVVG